MKIIDFLTVSISQIIAVSFRQQCYMHESLNRVSKIIWNEYWRGLLPTVVCDSLGALTLELFCEQDMDEISRSVVSVNLSQAK